MKGLIIAGTSSGCGKTTLTLGLMSLLQDAGFNIAPFKTGPDFIDPAFHYKVTGIPSYNLDNHLLDNEALTYLFGKHCKGKNFAIVEGVMGLFDGLGFESAGGTAQLSKLLKLPVILVVNCKSLYQSIAAIICGYTKFDLEVNISGVILNHVSGKESFAFLKNYIEMHTGVPCVGYIPTNQDISFENRHLGLVQAAELSDLTLKLKKIKEILVKTIDMEILCNIAEGVQIPSSSFNSNHLWKRDLHGLRIGVAYDHAFQFYYRDNFELLVENGAELIYFSPLDDELLPKDIHAFYFGGGYPEMFAPRLSGNQSMITDLKKAVQSGKPIFAECGGLMYLTSGIITMTGETYPMSGVFNCISQMTNNLQHFGYCDVSYLGCETKAHEFHYSRIIPVTAEQNFQYQFSIQKPEKHKYWKCGLQTKNVLAGYPHFHFWSSPLFYQKLMDLWMQKTISC